ncbi:MAG TPA: NADH-quinone oxidoreductase subunit D [Candidatus Marinimicrobia bacterium]|jgi:NADH-quinone oxidoreductase subunit D|nr:NADH-quinone oxidoreductase subunit D [Candidatus Neomarinimicrobiota bacterium]MDP7121488.1 NADH-quinone oxidoreductase subunit D [Candidatus Neomarinimicrobiota bacterium]MDP7483732.1 NADH-quinone oxidoreductase subunit D [Candidatus Neomarinimicrobiota bacterium]MDP7528934.1 NADH-quinone oxidoreductase subunit D [Candidatus Neomarinimicrobiota bacterium]MDP7716360.1 NADH-quinone oxidoreductase subunit D [Candidatus Neomarinimicrobiota bacterium]|tara:strand:+ start:1626 stop:2771 length:1146 start_codon:yes stop_codon:yes gene_type:complete
MGVVIEQELGTVHGDEMILNIGPQHPSTHGVLRLKVHTDGEIITQITPYIGYLHRCFEKHCENLTYEQSIPYTDRCDYIGSMNNNFGYAVAVEQLMETKVPEKVEYMRVIVAEMNRIASHLLALGTFGLDVGAFTPFLYCFRDRERILDLFEMLCGARLLYNYIWIGGVSHDFPVGWVEKTYEFLDYFEPKINEYNDLLTYNKIFIERSADVGVIPADVAISYGVTGPNLRGSGVRWDLRKDDPYGIYDRFEFDIPIGTGAMGSVGDCWDRYYVRVRELEECVKIIRQALDVLPRDGDVHAALPKKIRPKAGHVYSRTESPRGDLGYYIASDGSDIPSRIKMRSPAFTALSCLNEISRGWMISDVIAILGSLDIVLGEIDR